MRDLKSGLAEKGKCFLGFDRGIAEFDVSAVSILRHVQTKSYVNSLVRCHHDWLLSGQQKGLIQLHKTSDFTLLRELNMAGSITEIKPLGGATNEFTIATLKGLHTLRVTKDHGEFVDLLESYELQKPVDSAVELKDFHMVYTLHEGLQIVDRHKKRPVRVVKRPLESHKNWVMWLKEVPGVDPSQVTLFRDCKKLAVVDMEGLKMKNVVNLEFNAEVEPKQQTLMEWKGDVFEITILENVGGYFGTSRILKYRVGKKKQSMIPAITQ